MKKSTDKWYFLATVMIVATATLLTAGCANQYAENPPTREDTIPENAVKMTPKTDLYPPILHSDEWEQPVPVQGLINTAGAEDSPFVLSDGSILFFFFTPDVNKSPVEQVQDGVTGIYVSKNQNGYWSNPERVILQSPGKLSLDGCECVQDDIMWFCSVREGNFREIDVYTAEFKDGKWKNWRNAGEKLNVDYKIGEFHLTSDQNELYFHSERPGGRGGLDIWVTRKVKGEWQEPENVGVCNTQENEGWPFMTDNGEELWFTRTYEGTSGIFRSKKEGGKWGEPESILSQFAGEPSLDHEGNLYFVHHFFRDGKMIEADIYVAYHKKPQFLGNVVFYRKIPVYPIGEDGDHRFPFSFSCFLYCSIHVGSRRYPRV